jgi:hypothetical protein
MPTLIGVISDTHGLVRPEALTALAGVNYIIHAGDVGAPEVLEAFGKIAPVFAVRGNVDTQPWAQILPVCRDVLVEKARLHVLHRIADLSNPLDNSLACVITGHSHQAHQELRDGMLYLNPGSIGPRRFRLPVTLAMLTIDGECLDAEIVTLSAT